MKGKLLLTLFAVAWLLAVVPLAGAAQTRVYVSEIIVNGVQNRDELKNALPNLLASRLTSDSILVVDKAADADVTVAGTYLVLGRVFSIDVTARDKSGKVLVRGFEEGGSPDEMIPALGKLAQKLIAGISSAYLPQQTGQVGDAINLAAPGMSKKATVVAPVVTVVPVAVPLPAGNQLEPVAVGTSDIIRAQPKGKASQPGALIQRIEGELTGIAAVRELGDGEREVFVTGLHSLCLYRIGKLQQLLYKQEFPADSRVLGVDSADLDGDGVPEAYVTIMSGETLASQVWVVKDNALKMVAEKLPYYFRGIALAAGERKIYAQQMGVDVDFFGDVFELVKRGNGYELKNPFRLPRYGNIFTFNFFTDRSSKMHGIIINEAGNLVVYSPTGEELWRSGEKYGGSELYFQREDQSNVRVTGDRYRWVFLQQRISVTGDGDIIVSQNLSGLFSIGYNRSYNKNTLFALGWNGAALEEKWRTRVAEGYLADYFYDSQRKELVLLQVVKKDGLFSKGASVVVVKSVE